MDALPGTGEGGHDQVKEAKKHGKRTFTGSWSVSSRHLHRGAYPGILHNFANPSRDHRPHRLLQRRLEEAIRKTREAFPEAERTLSEDHAKLLKDIELITTSRTGSSTCSNTFREVLRHRRPHMQQINLSELVENEIKFFDFYLDFKHNVKKIMDLDGDLHDVNGSPADYSMFISTWVRYAMEAMRRAREGVLRLHDTPKRTCHP